VNGANVTAEYRTLYEDIFDELGALPVIDVHMHLKWKRERPAHLADVLLYQAWCPNLDSACDSFFP
jgi:hypothetical protein